MLVDNNINVNQILLHIIYYDGPYLSVLVLMRCFHYLVITVTWSVCHLRNGPLHLLSSTLPSTINLSIVSLLFDIYQLTNRYTLAPTHAYALFTNNTRIQKLQASFEFIKRVK